MKNMAALQNKKIFWKKKQQIAKSTLFDESVGDFNETELIILPNKIPKLTKQKCESNGEDLKQDGITLAEKGFFSEALNKLNKAAACTPDDCTLYEMKAQILIELEEDCDAVRSAEKCVKLNRLWSTGWHTLARTQLNIQHLSKAVKSFSRSIFLDPSSVDVRGELDTALERLKTFQTQAGAELSDNTDTEDEIEY